VNVFHNHNAQNVHTKSVKHPLLTPAEQYFMIVDTVFNQRQP